MGLLRLACDRHTPTGVGTTSAVRPRWTGASAHPHGRGDDLARWFWGEPVGGTPPRAWGRPVPGRPGRDRPRHTPTGVGTTPGRSPSSTKAAAHPHGRGDDGSQYSTSSSVAGTPPRAWGRHFATCGYLVSKLNPDSFVSVFSWSSCRRVPLGRCSRSVRSRSTFAIRKGFVTAS